jgi:predicted O-methyltransferase YrrM
MLGMLTGILSSLKYPRRKSAIKYLMRKPSMVHAMLSYPDPSKYYFSKTLEEICYTNIVSCLNNFLPDKFMNHVKEKGIKYINDYCLILYLLVRKYKPDIVVETGVARGVSSAVMLCAMQENGKGHLYSIELPPSECSMEIRNGRYVLGDGQVHGQFEIGYAIPRYLKDRWTLILGDSQKELPPLLKKTQDISIFFHDSLHTYEHMLFEYNVAWPHITKGGFLLSHDVIWNKAFLEFSKKVNSKPLIIYKSLGAIRKD